MTASASAVVAAGSTPPSTRSTARGADAVVRTALNTSSPPFQSGANFHCDPLNTPSKWNARCRRKWTAAEWQPDRPEYRWSRSRRRRLDVAVDGDTHRHTGWARVLKIEEPDRESREARTAGS
jgi:hypothetical protein